MGRGVKRGYHRNFTKIKGEKRRKGYVYSKGCHGGCIGAKDS